MLPHLKFHAWFAALAVVCAMSAHAQTSKTVTVVVPYGPGGGVDTFTRPLAAKLQTALSATIVVDNRAGAGGTIGVQKASAGLADGTVLLSGGVHQLMAEGLYPKRGYEMDKAFIPLAVTAKVPNVVVVTQNAPYSSIKELIAYAKSNPGKVNYCSSGNGTAQHIFAATFAKQADIRLTHIPYKGTAAAMNDLISGQCEVMFDGLGTSAQQIQSGRIRLLAVTTAKRTPLFPQAPTLAEAGGPPMDASIWYGWWAPTKTPADVVARLRKALRAELVDPEVQRFWRAQGAEAPVMSESEMEAFVKAETQHWKKAVLEMGISVD